jgi:hypothetical protein
MALGTLHFKMLVVPEQRNVLARVIEPRTAMNFHHSFDVAGVALLLGRVVGRVNEPLVVGEFVGERVANPAVLANLNDLAIPRRPPNLGDVIVVLEGHVVRLGRRLVEDPHRGRGFFRHALCGGTRGVERHLRKALALHGSSLRAPSEQHDEGETHGHPPQDRPDGAQPHGPRVVRRHCRLGEGASDWRWSYSTWVR